MHYNYIYLSTSVTSIWRDVWVPDHPWCQHFFGGLGWQPKDIKGLFFFFNFVYVYSLDELKEFPSFPEIIANKFSYRFLLGNIWVYILYGKFQCFFLHLNLSMWRDHMCQFVDFQNCTLVNSEFCFYALHWKHLWQISHFDISAVRVCTSSGCRYGRISNVLSFICFTFLVLPI